jgi:hypothetical protein
VLISLTLFPATITHISPICDNNEFHIHGSVHRDSVLIRSNEMQQYAGVYLLQNDSTSCGCLSHPSSGVHQTVTAASGTGHSVRATTVRQRGLKATLTVCISLVLINMRQQCHNSKSVTFRENLLKVLKCYYFL